MAGAWEKRVEIMMAEAFLKGNAHLREGMSLAAESLGPAVRKGVTETSVIRFDMSVMVPGLTMSRDGAIAIDSVGCIGKVLLTAKNHRLVDLQVPSDFNACQQMIRNAFKALRLPKRALVYLAWTPGQPEIFYYVGRGGSDARLELRKHGKLARALHDAKMLTLMFARQSADAPDLEGSVMQLIKAITGKIPIHNDAEEFPPFGEGGKVLCRFGEVFEILGKGIAKHYGEE